MDEVKKKIIRIELNDNALIAIVISGVMALAALLIVIAFSI